MVALQRVHRRAVPDEQCGHPDRVHATYDPRSISSRIAGAFGLPCIFLADNPGVLAGTAAEGQGILRHAARLFAVQHRLTVPKLHVTLRKAFGFGSSVMAMNPFDGQTITLAFPSITLGALPAGSGREAASAHLATQIGRVMAYETWKAKIHPAAFATQLATALGRLRYGR